MHCSNERTKQIWLPPLLFTRSILPFAKVFIMDLQLENCSYCILHTSMQLFIKKLGRFSSSIMQYLLRIACNVMGEKYHLYLYINQIRSWWWIMVWQPGKWSLFVILSCIPTVLMLARYKNKPDISLQFPSQNITVS